MKNILFSAVILSSLIFMSHLGFTEGVVESAKEKTKRTKDQVVQEMEENVKKMQTKIDGLRADVKDKAGDVHTDVSSQLENLEKDQQALKEKLNEIKKNTGGAWRDLKKGFDDAFERLGDGVRKAREKFKK